MKTILHLLLISLLVTSCANPQKVLERNNPDKALDITLRRLKKGKIKTKHLPVLEEAFRIVTERDRLAIQKMRSSERPDIWPAVYTKAINIEDRQARVTSVRNRLHQEGFSVKANFLPAQKIKEEAATKSAIYYYARAQEQLIQGRNGDRNAARTTYNFLSQCLSYVPDFQDAVSLKNEMKAAGTTHVLVRSQTNPYLWNDASLFQNLFWNIRFPLQEEWQVIHRIAPQNEEIDYAIDFQFTDVYVSNNRTLIDVCQASKEVENGFIEKEIWSDRDSAYIKVKEIQYITVYAEVETIEQSKESSIRLEADFIDLRTNTYFDRRSLYGRDTWKNEFDKVRGDRRALSSCVCPRTLGICSSFPSDDSMIDDAVDDLRWSMQRLFRTSLD